MKVYNSEQILKIRTLRSEGYSIGEIVKLCNTPKTSVWHHIKGIKLTTAQKKRISSERGGSKLRKEAMWEKAEKEVSALFSGRSNRDLIMSVASLYWAEGSKREIVFTNTDSNMVNLYLLFLQKIFQTPLKEVYLLIRISDPINPKDALQFWNKMTKIPKVNITINHNNIQNKTKTAYGIARISLKKGGYKLKVMQCIIRRLQKDLLLS